MSKTLFESKIDSIKTPENAIYLEAVVELFNTLFEDQIGDIVDRNMFPLAGVEFKDLPQYIPEHPRDALNSIVAGLIDKSDAFTGLVGAKDAQTYIPEQYITTLRGIHRADVTNKDALTKTIKALTNIIKEAYPKSKDEYQGNFQNVKKIYAKNGKQTVINIATSLKAFYDTLKDAYKWVTTEYSPKKTPDMYIAKKPKDEPKKEKETFVTKDMLDKMGEEPTVTEKLTDAAKPVKTKGKDKKPEPATVVDPTAEYKDIQFATVDLSDTSSRKVTMTNVKNVELVVNALQHAIELVCEVKYHFIRPEGISLSSDMDNNTVTITVNDAFVDEMATHEQKTPMNVFTKYNVLLYSLFMYAKNMYPMDENCILSELTAKSIVHDMGAGRQAALRYLLTSRNENTMSASKVFNINNVKSILTSSGITDPDDLNNLSFAITQCIGNLGNSKLNNGMTIADRDSQLAEKENDSVNTKKSKSELKKTYDDERASFNNNVAGIAGNSSNSSFDLYGLDTSEGDMYKIDEYVKKLDEGNVYEKIVDKLNSTSENDDNIDDVKLNGSYAEDASRVVDSCNNAVAASDTTNQRKATKKKSEIDLDYDTEFDTDSMFDTDSSTDEMSSVESNADFNPDNLR